MGMLKYIFMEIEDFRSFFTKFSQWHLFSVIYNVFQKLYYCLAFYNGMFALGSSSRT